MSNGTAVYGFKVSNEESANIAQNIIRSIDRGILARLGARDFQRDGSALLFRIGSGRARKVKITLTADDLYVVQCFEMRGSLKAGNLRCECSFEEGTGDHGGLYFDMLDDSLLRLEREVLS